MFALIANIIIPTFLLEDYNLDFVIIINLTSVGAGAHRTESDLFPFFS